MFGTIRKHQTWLWAIIITLTIISFVIFFSPYSKMSSDPRRSRDYGSIYGKKVTDQDFIDAWKEVHLHQFVMSGRWPDEEKSPGFDPERLTYQWLLLGRKQEQLNIHISDEAAARMARQMMRSFERMGVSSPQLFIERILQPKGFRLDDFERFVRHFVGIQELISAAGMSGTLIPPDEAKVLYKRDHQEVATEAAFFWGSNYLAQVTTTPEILTQFYSNRVATYRIPDRVQVSYVRFNVTNYLASAEASLTNLSEIVDVNFQRFGTNAVPDAKTPEEVKARLREQILRQQALGFARSNAVQFANQLFAIEPARPENLKALAASNNLPAAVSAPFSREDGPEDIKGGPELAKAAFALNAEDPFSQVVMAQDGAYVMALDKQLASETPTFQAVQDRVTADYKRMQSLMLAQQAARTFQQSLTNGLAQGKAFTNLCAEANVKPVDLPPFSISTRSLEKIEEMIPLGQLKQAAFSTDPGQASPVVPNSEGAMIVYVKAKLPLDPAKEQKELPGYVAQLRRNRQQEAFDEWLRRESEKGLRDTPLAKPQQAPPGAGAAAAKS